MVLASTSDTETVVQSDVRWRKNPKCAFTWRDWGGDSVVFELRSGHTHQFAPLAAAVMAGFEEHVCSVEELAVSVCADLGVAVDNDVRLAVAAAVEQFLALGWIEPTEPT